MKQMNRSWLTLPVSPKAWSTAGQTLKQREKKKKYLFPIVAI
jgi:hypothetical protein